MKNPMGRLQSIDLWLVSRPTEGTMKYSDRHLAGLSASKAPDRVELIGAGSLGYDAGPAPYGTGGPAPASAEG